MTKKCVFDGNEATHTKPLGIGQIDVPLCDEHREAVFVWSFGPQAFENMSATMYPSYESLQQAWDTGADSTAK